MTFLGNTDGGARAWALKQAEPQRAGPTMPAYGGSRGQLFWIALGRMMMTILTLGIGRFWMITRLRRFYWSSIRIDGAPLEYTGRAGEKLIGFLIAVVIIAVYLVIVNLALTFIGLSFFQGNPLALQLPLIALLPLIFWAQYRARRYVFARTRWRGIRFGMEPGAWGYMFRALFWGFMTLISAGLLYPLMQMKLARYTTDRTYYGDMRFEQRGTWWPLFRSWMLFWLPIPILIAGAVFYAQQSGSLPADLGLSLPNGAETSDAAEIDPTAATGLIALSIAIYFWMIFAFIRHQIFSFRYINSHKVLGEETWFEFKLGTWTVIGIYVLGNIVISLLLGLIVFACVLVSAGAMFAIGVDFTLFEQMSEGQMPNITDFTPFLILFAAYLPAVAAAAALNHAFIMHPLLRSTASTTTIHGVDAAMLARQRVHDHQREAGGFADALGADLGGAF